MEADFSAVWAKVREVEGWLTEGQARRLWQCSQDAPGGQFVEIGSHHGKSAAVIATGRADSSLLAIDPWDDPRWGGGSESFNRFEETLAALACRERVEIFRGLSSEAHQQIGPRQFDFVYIDGAHDFRTVRDDIKSWGSRINPGGFMAIHDSFSSIGVTRALFAELFLNRQWRYCGRERSLSIFQKQRESLLSWVATRLRMAADILWFARNLAVKYALRHRWSSVARLLGHHQTTDPF